MNKNNLNKLSLEQRNKLHSYTLYKDIPFEVRAGWFELIEELGKNISELCERLNEPLPKVRQIKEKFGTLRFYYTNESKMEVLNKAISAMVQISELRSAHVCEICGDHFAQTIIDDYRVETVCDKHRSKNSQTLEEFNKINKKHRSI